jgi:hypothetical protein
MQSSTIAAAIACHPAHEQGLFGNEVHNSPGLLLWKGKTSGEMGEECSVTYNVEAV